MLSVSVVIPTFQRPTWLRRAVLSLASQAPPPDEVIAVARDTDGPTHEEIARLQAEPLPFVLRKGVVSEPGFMPPVFAGMAQARHEVVAVMDDDAEACEGWVSGLLSRYADPAVGGVGGRCINMVNERPADVDATDRVGYVSWLGRFVGNMYKRPTFTAPVDVDFFMGGCMSYRRAVAESLRPDYLLNGDVAFGYEVDLGLQARASGWRLLFDPAIAIRHYSAPRPASGMRRLDDERAVEAYSYNHIRILVRRLSPARRLVALVWSFVLGERRAPGIIPWLVWPLARLAGYQTSVGRAALRGRLGALRGGRAERGGSLRS